MYFNDVDVFTFRDGRIAIKDAFRGSLNRRLAGNNVGFSWFFFCFSQLRAWHGIGAEVSR